jgi:hypothetical protein
MSDVRVFGVSVECEAGCDLDEMAVIVVDAQPMLALAGIDVLSYDECRGLAVVGKIQAGIVDVVDNPDTYVAFNDDDWGGADAVLGFLIVVRDAILAHRFADTKVKVTT